MDFCEHANELSASIKHDEFDTQRLLAVAVVRRVVWGNVNVLCCRAGMANMGPRGTYLRPSVTGTGSVLRCHTVQQVALQLQLITSRQHTINQH